MNPHVSNSLLQLSGLLGMVMPVLVSIVKQDRLSRRVNAVISVALSVLVAAVTCLARSQFSAGNLLGSFVALYIASAASYHSFFGPTGVDATLSKVTSLLKGGDKPAAVVTAGTSTGPGGTPSGEVVAAPPGT